MATQIEKKVQRLRQQHFDLGTQQTPEVDCGYGGRMQTFANATIYYHPVMGSEAREVHGGIRTKYLGLGGHDTSPTWGQRLFGFPLTDEKNSDDGMCRVSRFEWGAIYWTFGCTWLVGKIYEEYLRAGGEKGRLGYPIAEPQKLSDGVAVFFEHGLMYQGRRSSNTVIEVRYGFPQLGHPWLMPSSTFNTKEVISFSFNKSHMNANIAGHLAAELFNGRIFLKETGNNKEVPLMFDFTDMKQLPGFAPAISKFSSAVRIQGLDLIKQSRLYDIILKFPSRSHSIAPHSLYFKDNWDDFNFIHATDVHVSRRLDGFRKFFTDRTMHDAVRNFNNFNDNFREFIRYANKLHKQGLIDFVVLTGDLVDYVFEDGGKHYHNNNFVYLENIIRGLTGKPDKVQNDELLVPVFTSLGNHDYRIRAYYPLFTVDIQAPASNRTMEQFGSMNITKDEARILTEQHLGITEMVSSDTAIDMIKPDRENRDGNLDHYFKSINRDASYEVQLGNHRLIMIDGKWDGGTIEGTWDAIVYYLGFKGEAEDNFADGSPDSVGFNSTELTMVSRALQNDGLVIICMHAPVINPKHSEYSWFLREYLRSANPQPFKKEMLWYLYRRDPKAFIIQPGQVNAPITIDLTKDAYAGWSRQHTFYFHEGDGGDLLDYGVMRGFQENFLKLITGVQNSPRPADLILSGHVHKNFESRLLWNAQAGKFQFSHEFFTENPSVYYHSYDMNTGDETKFTMSPFKLKEFFEENSQRIHIEITDQAAGNEKPVKNSSGVWSLKTKPYPLTLASQQDNAHCKWWWSNVKPLLVQTAALGPSEFLRSPEHQPDFRGCRYVKVNDGVIEKIKYVKHDDIKNYQPDAFDPRIFEIDRSRIVT